jgi:glycosyltransferase involved in cell wall biosynthesis
MLIYPLARMFKIPLVITFHGMDASPQLTVKPEYKRRLGKMLDYAGAIIIVSPHMKDTLRLNEHLHKTHIIPCGVNPDEFDRVEHSQQNDSITILHSGRLVSKKGVPDLIRVFAILSHRYSNIRLNVIGDGPELDLCRLAAEDARAGSIHFLGARPHEEVKRCMAEADIFVLNSREGDNGDMEGVPVSLLEAMSMKLAVVSTFHAGIPYAITNEVDGILVEEKNNIALSAALVKVISNEPLRMQLGEAARRTVVNKFTLTETVRKISDVYKTALKSS